MKAILFLAVLLFSSSSHSALFETVKGFADNPFGNAISGCSDTSCIERYSDPYVYEDAVEPENPINNDSYFTIGSDLVDRRMSTGSVYVFEESVDLLFEWTTFDVYNAYAGIRIPGGGIFHLPDNGSGSFILSILVGLGPLDYQIDVFGLAKSLDSYIELKFSLAPPPSEVPLPASLFLFAPALLGLIGIRRKLS